MVQTAAEAFYNFKDSVHFHCIITAPVQRETGWPASWDVSRGRTTESSITWCYRQNKPRASNAWEHIRIVHSIGALGNFGIEERTEEKKKTYFDLHETKQNKTKRVLPWWKHNARLFLFGWLFWTILGGCCSFSVCLEFLFETTD